MAARWLAGRCSATSSCSGRLGDEDLERLRSTEAGNASGDEVLREIADEKTIRHVRGCLRGLNPWLLAHLPNDKRQRISQLQQLMGLGNVKGDKALIERCEADLRDMGVARSKRFFGVGNAGEPEWVWEVMDLSEDDSALRLVHPGDDVRQHPAFAQRTGKHSKRLGAPIPKRARWNYWVGVPWAWATRSIPSCS